MASLQSCFNQVVTASTLLQAEDLRRHCGLEFVTSSLLKKVEAMKDKLHADSIRVPDTTSLSTESDLQNTENSEKKHPNSQPSVGYEIAASAASYVQTRVKDLLSLRTEPQQKRSEKASEGKEGQGLKEEDSSSPRVYKTEAVLYVAAATTKAAFTAGEKEKEAAARALQSLQTSSFEWFLCDDASISTRYFVIQVIITYCK